MSAIKTKAAPIKPARLIYCGPNLPGGVLPQFTVFKGRISEHLNDLIEKCPAVGALIVPVADLAKTQNDIAIKGTPAHTQYGQVLNFIKKGA